MYQLDFLNYLTKNQFIIEPGHLRRIWDFGTKGFDKANSILFCPFLFVHYLESYFEKKRSNKFHKNGQRRSGFSSSRAFCTWSWICCNPFGSLANWFFVCVYWGSNSNPTHWCQLTRYTSMPVLNMLDKRFYSSSLREKLPQKQRTHAFQWIRTSSH